MLNLSQNGYSHEEILDLLIAPDSIYRTTYALYALRDKSIFRKLNANTIHIECSAEDSVKYGGRFTFEADENLNWGTDRIQPYMQLRHKGFFFEWPLSPPMRVVKDDEEITYSGVTVSAEAYDESSFLRNNNLGSTIPYESATPYISIISDIMGLADYKDFLVDPTDKTLQTSREFEEGTNLLELVNSLLREINYISLEPDRSGVLMSREYAEPYNKTPLIQYYSGKRSIIQEPITRTRDSRDKHNIFIGYYTNPDSEVSWREVRRNESPSSPLSITNVGYAITAAPVKYDNVADRETLYDLVYRQMQEETLSYDKWSFNSVIMPHHEVGEIVSIDNELISGIFEEIYWSIDVTQSEYDSSFSMTHRVRGLYSD